MNCRIILYFLCNIIGQRRLYVCTLVHCEIGMMVTSVLHGYFVDKLAKDSELLSSVVWTTASLARGDFGEIWTNSPAARCTQSADKAQPAGHIISLIQVQLFSNSLHISRPDDHLALSQVLDETRLWPTTPSCLQIPTLSQPHPRPLAFTMPSFGHRYREEAVGLPPCN